MRIVEVHNFGQPEVLQIFERDIPAAGPGSVVVQLRAIGINPVETYIRAGTYPALPELPYIPGGNGAGIVHALGKGTQGFNIGQRVYIASNHGTYAEYCCLPQEDVYPLPQNASFEQGAAIGTPAATAYRALFIRGQGKPGEKVLIHGASGSVGQAAVQLGLAAGMQITGTAGTEEGRELIAQYGAVALPHGEAPTVRLRKPGLKGFDLILEMLANKNLETDLALLAPGGRVVIIGSRGRIEIDPRATMAKETDIRGLAMANSSPQELKLTHRALYEAMEKGSLQVEISKAFPLELAAEAHHLVMETGNCGKIILLP